MNLFGYPVVIEPDIPTPQITFDSRETIRCPVVVTPQSDGTFQMQLEPAATRMMRHSEIERLSVALADAAEAMRLAAVLTETLEIEHAQGDQPARLSIEITGQAAEELFERCRRWRMGTE